MSAKNFKIRLGKDVYDTSTFEEACGVVEAYTNAERKAFDDLKKKVENDSLLVYSAHFWSGILGRAAPPTQEEWVKPLATLYSARSAWGARMEDAALGKLKQAIDEYNAVHTKWVTYRNDLVGGAETGLLIMELTVTAASAVFAPGASASMVRAAGAGAAWTGYTDLASQVGLKLTGVEQHVDVGQLTAKTIAAFAGGLVAGKLSSKFLDVFMKRCNRGYVQILFAGAPLEVSKKVAYTMGKLAPSAFQDVVSKVITGLPLSVLREAATKAVLKARTEQVNLEQFLDLIVKEVTATNAFKESFATALGAKASGRVPGGGAGSR